MLLLIAVVGLILGFAISLKRRVDRFHQSGLAYSTEANRLKWWLMEHPHDRGEFAAISGYIHWNDAVVDDYFKRAITPWNLSDPDPSKVVCTCSKCLSGNGILPFGQTYDRVAVPEVPRNPQ